MPSSSGHSRSQFEAGLAAGLDPDHSIQPGEPGIGRAVTGLRSRWLHRRCPVCGHTFRLGDEVLGREDGSVVHDMPGLRCGEPSSDAPPASRSELRARFFEGLNEAWPMPGEITLHRLEGDHPLLAPPHRGHQRASCRVCGHTFRPGDLVVICPCSPNQPKCRAAVHRDILNQLHCWDEWMKARSDDTCLGMS